MSGSASLGFVGACGRNGKSVETSGIEVDLDFQTITTGTGMRIDLDGLTSGDGLAIRVDSDVVTTGKALNIYSGSAMTTSVFSVDEDGDIANAGTLTLASTKKLILGAANSYLYESSAGKVALNASASISLTGAGVSVANDITLTATKKLILGQTGSYINESTAGKVVIAASGSGADDITLAGTVTVNDDVKIATGKKITIDQGKLTIGSTAITAEAADINGMCTNIATKAAFTVNAEAANAITVNVQFNTEDTAAVAYAVVAPWWLSTDSDGQTLSAAPDGGLAAGTDGTIIAEWTADVCGLAISEADGDLDIVLTETGTSAFYLNVGLPNGKHATSGIIQFT